MKLILPLIFIILIFSTFTSQAVQEKKPLLAIAQPTLSITSGLYFKTYEKYNNYLRGDICLNFPPDYINQQIDRIIADLVITCAAFKEEGVKLNIEIVLFPNNQRAQAMVERGTIDTLITSVWLSDINPDVLFYSEAAVKKGEFEKGIYVHEKSPLLGMPVDKINFANYKAVTSKSWQHDKKILYELTPNVLEIDYLPSLMKILDSGRADLLLNSFPSNTSLVYTRLGVTLLPLPNIKVVLPDSRHFIASKKSANGSAYFKILNKGLIKLRQQQRIRPEYIKSGFININTQDWQIINVQGLH